MPDIPDVRIAALVAIAERFIVGAWRAWPIRNFGFEACHDARKNTAEFGEVILPHLIPNVGGKRGTWRPAHCTFCFVVAAPEHDAGMIAQTADLVFRLGFDV